MITFFDRIKDIENTLLIIEDEYGYVFGCFCNEPWRPTHKFFGTGENLLLTFKDGDMPDLYSWTGNGEQHMYADNNSLGVGGSV